MKVLRYLIFGDPPSRGLSPRRWRRFVRIQTPHVARWLRLNEVDRQLTLEHDVVRERFDPVSSLGEPLQIEWGPLTGGSWDPVNGWVNLTDDEIRERHPEFYRLAMWPLVVYEPGTVFEHLTSEEKARGPFFCTSSGSPHPGATLKVLTREPWSGQMTCHAHAPHDLVS